MQFHLQMFKLKNICKHAVGEKCYSVGMQTSVKIDYERTNEKKIENANKATKDVSHVINDAMMIHLYRPNVNYLEKVTCDQAEF